MGTEAIPAGEVDSWIKSLEGNEKLPRKGESGRIDASGIAGSRQLEI
jgi:hypothetical protein